MSSTAFFERQLATVSLQQVEKLTNLRLIAEEVLKPTATGRSAQQWSWAGPVS